MGERFDQRAGEKWRLVDQGHVKAKEFINVHRVCPFHRQVGNSIFDVLLINSLWVLKRLKSSNLAYSAQEFLDLILK